MPTYRVKCDKCNKQKTIVCTIENRNKQKCDESECSQEMRVIPSTSGFSLKGGGWYKDGYSS